MSGEDLCNVGPVALLQDLVVQAALGVTSVERNGHHYFKGLSAWPAAVQAHVLKEHGDV
jgi:cyclopropane fatty-acyl-phospholipid synthase-like methyltransferase